MALAVKVCTTCKRKCRKCDGSQPACRRCATKGLICEGYLDKYKAIDIASRDKWKDPEKPLSNGELTVPFPQSTHKNHNISRSPKHNTIYQLRQDSHKSLSFQARTTQVAGITCWNENLRVLQQDDVDMPDIPDINLPDLTIEDLLSSESMERTLMLLSYYEQHVCPEITVSQPGERNPFREDVLPLAYHHVGLLHAILGLAACHMKISKSQDLSSSDGEALKHCLAANRWLKKQLIEETKSLLPMSQINAILATLTILALQDVCDGGMSSNDLHLISAAYMCKRLLADKRYISAPGEMSAYLLGSLAWLDLMRGLSNTATLIFTQDDRRRIVRKSGPDLELITGCHKSLFLLLGDIVSSEWSFQKGSVSRSTFQRFLQQKEAEVRAWEDLPTSHPNPQAGALWNHLNVTIQHACILSLLRLAQPKICSLHGSDIQASVDQILDSTSQIASTNPLAKRLLFPLAIAAANATTSHQRHYCTLRVREIQAQTGVSAHTLLSLGQIWNT